MDFQEFKIHFPTTISEQLAEFVSGTALLNSRYIFTRSAAFGRQYGYCTHCKQKFRNEQTLKHKSEATCPNCRSTCKIQGSGLGRKYMRDQAVLIWYEKSIVAPQAITARTISVVRDYSGDPEQVETKYHVEAMYLFLPGEGGIHYVSSRQKQKTVFSHFDKGYSGASWPRFHCTDNIKQAVEGTPFQYSTWEQYVGYDNHRHVSDMVQFFDLSAKYPCIETMSKSGFAHLIWDKLYGRQTHGAVHWRGKTIFKALRLSKTDYRDIVKRNLQEKFTSDVLSFFQKERRQGATDGIDVMLHRYQLYKFSTEADKRFVHGFIKPDDLFAYLLKQTNRPRSFYRSITNAFQDYRDYLGECIVLGMDLGEDRYLRPNNLHGAHQKTSSKVKIKDNKLNEAKIFLRLQNELAKATYDEGGLLIRPAVSAAELFQEGKRLNICVGSYATRYADGETNIFLIRNQDEPDKPLYTCEISPKDWSIRQVRRYMNYDVPDEVMVFVNRFADRMKHMMKKSKPKKAVAI